jgi:MoxR-like ATPase
MGYPSRQNEARIVTEYGLPGGGPAASLPVDVIAAGAVARAREELAAVHMSDALVAYVLDIVAASRQSASVSLALSSRAAVALARCARIEAALRGAQFVVPDDVKRVAPWVIPHRIVLTPDAVLEGMSPFAEVDRFLATVPVPRETP